MVMRFGMSDLGPLTLDLEKSSPYEEGELSDEMRANIDREVSKIIDSGYKTAIQVLKDLRTKLDMLAQELLKEETLDAEDFIKLIGPKVAPVAVAAKTTRTRK
jgi:cell division protease FtsH